MLIDLRSISRGTSAVIPVDIAVSPRDMQLSYQGYSLAGPLSFTGELRNADNGVLHLTGRIQADLSGECSRCLKPVAFRLEHEISDWFRPAGTDSGKPAPAESLEDDETEELYYGYTGRTLALDQALRDEIILALPQRLLCKEDCAGLCPVCGQDLNEEECGCEKRENRSASPFDRLKELLED